MWNQNRVLVLNSSYEAINICSARRAILMLLAEKADIVEESRDYIHSSVFVMPMPEVIRLRRFINLPSSHFLPQKHHAARQLPLSVLWQTLSSG